MIDSEAVLTMQPFRAALRCGHAGARRVDGAEVVGVDHPPELIDADVVDPLDVRDARVVHQDVDPAEGVEGGLHDGGGAGLVGDVGEARHRLATGIGDLGHDLLRRLG